MAAIYFARAVIKIILLIIALPFILIWIWVKGCIFRRVLARELIAAGMPANHAHKLANEMRASSFLRKQK